MLEKGKVIFKLVYMLGLGVYKLGKFGDGLGIYSRVIAAWGLAVTGFYRHVGPPLGVYGLGRTR